MLFTFNVITVAVSGGTRFKHFEKLFAHRSWGRMKDEEFGVWGSGFLQQHWKRKGRQTHMLGTYII